MHQSLSELLVQNVGCNNTDFLSKAGPQSEFSIGLAESVSQSAKEKTMTYNEPEYRTQKQRFKCRFVLAIGTHQSDNIVSFVRKKGRSLRSKAF